MNVSYELLATTLAILFLVLEIRTLRHRLSQLEYRASQLEDIASEHESELESSWDLNNDRFHDVRESLQHLFIRIGDGEL